MFFQRDQAANNTPTEATPIIRAGDQQVSIDKNSVVIFNCHGVLADAVLIAYEAYRRTLLEEYKIDLTFAEFKPFIGGSSKTKMKAIIESKQLPLTAEQLLALNNKKEAILKELQTAGMARVPGALEFLQALTNNKAQTNIKIILISNSSLEKILQTLKIASIEQSYFDQIIPTDEWPSTESRYTKIAQELSVLPAKCIVFEDSTAGINSAAAAGMVVIGIKSNFAVEQDFSKANLTARFVDLKYLELDSSAAKSGTNVKTEITNKSKNMPSWIKKRGEEIPAATIEAAMNLYNTYADLQAGIELPSSVISFDDSNPDAVSVNIDVNYKYTQFNMRSVTPSDAPNVFKYLTSQELVCAQYASKQTSTLEATQERVKALADRFNPNTTESQRGLFMHGGFIVTGENEEFLGMINTGASDTPGFTEIGVRFRADAWSQAPKNLNKFNITDDEFLKKPYTGAGTAAVCALWDYTRETTKKGYKLLKHEVTGMRAVAMIDNPGGWKAQAKAGMVARTVDAVESYGEEIRFQTYKTLTP